MSVPAVRRIVVGVDGSAESAAALRWACREAGLRGAEVHAVYAHEAARTASYAVPSQARSPEDGDVDVDTLWRAVLPDSAAGVPVRTEVAPGLAARVLLERCAGADMLVLGTACDQAGQGGSAGPVIRACLRRSPCPVVVISGAPDSVRDASAHPTDVRIPEPSGTGAARGLGVIPVPAVLPI